MKMLHDFYFLHLYGVHGQDVLAIIAAISVLAAVIVYEAWEEE